MVNQIYQLSAPPVIVSGPGAAKEVGTLAKGIGGKALLITDTELEKIGLIDDIKSSLNAAGISVSIYNKVVTEPTIKYVEEGLEIYREAQAEFLVAVGGGSAIDTGKAISILATNTGKISNFAGINKIPVAGAPLIAIPTTAGTGSEVTLYTIITDTTRDVKMLFGSPHLMPKVALVDPLLTLKMPQGVTASTGLDALTHAIEAYISVKAQPITDVLALESIRLLAGNLRQAWSDGNNLEARTKVMLGSLLAGLAYSNSSVALVHRMALPIGAFFHVPHGISTAVLLPTVIEFSIPGNPKRYADIAMAMGESIKDLSHLDAAYLAAEAAKRLNRDLKVPSIRGLGVDEGKFEAVINQMATNALPTGLPDNNPRKATKEEVIELYKKAF